MKDLALYDSFHFIKAEFVLGIPMMSPATFSLLLSYSCAWSWSTCEKHWLENLATELPFKNFSDFFWNLHVQNEIYNTPMNIILMIINKKNGILCLKDVIYNYQSLYLCVLVNLSNAENISMYIHQKLKFGDLSHSSTINFKKYSLHSYVCRNNIMSMKLSPPSIYFFTSSFIISTISGFSLLRNQWGGGIKSTGGENKCHHF